MQERLEEARESGDPISQESDDAKSQESASLSRGDSLPAISLPDADGKIWSNSDLEGKVVLLNFWATWCAPCRKEMPYFDEAQKKYGESGFTVVAISVDRKGWEVVRPYLDELQPTYPVLLADDGTTESFGKITSLPTTFFVHRNGTIHSRHVGSMTKSHIMKDIESLLEKAPSTAAAL